MPAFSFHWAAARRNGVVSLRWRGGRVSAPTEAICWLAGQIASLRSRQIASLRSRQIASLRSRQIASLRSQ